MTCAFTLAKEDLQGCGTFQGLVWFVVTFSDALVTIDPTPSRSPRCSTPSSLQTRRLGLATCLWDDEGLFSTRLYRIFFSLLGFKIVTWRFLLAFSSFFIFSFFFITFFFFCFFHDGSRPAIAVLSFFTPLRLMAANPFGSTPFYPIACLWLSSKTRRLWFELLASTRRWVRQGCGRTSPYAEALGDVLNRQKMRFALSICVLVRLMLLGKLRSRNPAAFRFFDAPSPRCGMRKLPVVWKLGNVAVAKRNLVIAVPKTVSCVSFVPCFEKECCSQQR